MPNSESRPMEQGLFITESDFNITEQGFKKTRPLSGYPTTKM